MTTKSEIALDIENTEPRTLNHVIGQVPPWSRSEQCPTLTGTTAPLVAGLPVSSRLDGKRPAGNWELTHAAVGRSHALFHQRGDDLQGRSHVTKTQSSFMF